MIEQKARAVVNALEAVRTAKNGGGHDGPHNQDLRFDLAGEIQVYDLFGDCSACAGAEYGADDTLSRAVGDLRAALGYEVRPWERMS